MGDARTAVARFTEATWLDAQRRIGALMLRAVGIARARRAR